MITMRYPILNITIYAWVLFNTFSLQWDMYLNSILQRFLSFSILLTPRAFKIFHSHFLEDLEQAQWLNIHFKMIHAQTFFACEIGRLFLVCDVGV